jgi:hypothetical protein
MLIGGSIAALGVVSYYTFKGVRVSRAAKLRKVSSFEAARSSGLLESILFNVIAGEGKSKKYTDVIPLDGGTVGIAHFAVGGLSELYNEMDTQKYFGKSKAEMIGSYSNGCRPSGKTGNDTGWGCYSKAWWLDGMTRFVNSSESKKIQQAAWIKKMQKVVENAISKGWSTPRQIAIATGIANSVGAGGFNSLANNNGWDAEKTLQAYAGTNAHRLRRVELINKHYPSK